MAASLAKAHELSLTQAETFRPKEKADTPTFSKRIRDLLREIFEGHEEYLGLTPD